MYKLTFEKRVWIVKQILKGRSQADVALAQKISDRAIRKILVKYEEFGFDGLKDHKTGRSEIVLNQNAEVIILDLRRRFGYGPERIEHLLKDKGFGISHRQIYKFLSRNDLIQPNIKKQKSRKWSGTNFPTRMIYGIQTGLMILSHKNNLVFA